MLAAVAQRARGGDPHRPDLELVGHAPLRPRDARGAVRRRRDLRRGGDAQAGAGDVRARRRARRRRARGVRVRRRPAVQPAAGAGARDGDGPPRRHAPQTIAELERLLGMAAARSDPPPHAPSPRRTARRCSPRPPSPLGALGLRRRQPQPPSSCATRRARSARRTAAATDRITVPSTPGAGRALPARGARAPAPRGRAAASAEGARGAARALRPRRRSWPARRSR